MSESLVIEFEWDEGDLAAAERLAGTTRRRWLTQPVIFLAILGLAYLRDGYLDPIPVVIGTVLAAITVESIRRKTLRQSNLGAIAVRLGPEGVQVCNRLAHTRHPWKAYERWAESESIYLLLFRGSQTFHIVPKRALSEQSEARFRALVSEHLS
ncbi:MAG: YcxB family protein [Candidatus Eremiobacteraeota bacterium]|nr:YcxB family protein [Candidatus Eremiobacteraeota bacterium]